jgi:hypothetical protein
VHALTRRRPAPGRAGAALSVLCLAAALTLAGAGRATAAGPGGCAPYVAGTVVPVPCSAGPETGGDSDQAGGGTSASGACTMVPVDQQQAQSLGLSWPPPAGETWALLDCLGGAIGPGPQAVLVSTAGAPQVTPEQLLIQALKDLRVPALQPDTAPPPGADGLVGLPEWFWIPAASWHPLTVTVTAGPVWATVTATPSGVRFSPGTNAGPVTCAGPGNAYDPAISAADQQTGCSYTYVQPSAGLPGDAYQASVTVVWSVVWTGSGGAGGVLASTLSVPVSVPIRVAQAEALVTGT